MDLQNTNAFYASGIVETELNTVKTDWLVREGLTPCRERNMINESLVEEDRILFPLLHIKLGLMRQFATALNKHGLSFQFLCKTFPNLSTEKC